MSKTLTVSSEKPWYLKTKVWAAFLASFTGLLATIAPPETVEQISYLALNFVNVLIYIINEVRVDKASTNVPEHRVVWYKRQKVWSFIVAYVVSLLAYLTRLPSDLLVGIAGVIITLIGFSFGTATIDVKNLKDVSDYKRILDDLKEND